MVVDLFVDLIAFIALSGEKKKALKPNDFKTFKVVETAELESATPCMSSKYSNQLSYASVFAFDIIHSFFSLVNAFLNFVPILK